MLWLCRLLLPLRLLRRPQSLPSNRFRYRQRALRNYRAVGLVNAETSYTGRRTSRGSSTVLMLQ